MGGEEVGADDERDGSQDGRVGRHEAEEAAQRRENDYESDGQGRGRAEQEHTAGTARLAEWGAAADDEYDEHLGEHGLQKPAGLETALTEAKYPEEGYKSDEVEDRAQWPEDPHKFTYICDTELMRAFQLLGVDRISGYTKLRPIIE